MADSQLTLLTLPHEILWQILKIHFSGITFRYWDQKFILGSPPSHYDPRPSVPRPVQSYDVLLSCQALRLVGTQAMFEFATFQIGGYMEQLIDELPPSIPFRKFRRITLPLLESEPLEKWPWSKLRVMEVVDLRPVPFHARQEVTKQCKKLKEMLDYCNSHEIEATADITFFVSPQYQPGIDILEWMIESHAMRFVVDKSYNLSLLSMTDLLEAHFDILQSVLKETFNLVIPKPKWAEDDFKEGFSLVLPRVGLSNEKARYQ